MLTSGRAIDILIGPAGSGKTRTVAVIGEAWRDAGVGRVVGLTASTNAAHVLAGEGIAEACNLADFLGRLDDGGRTRGHRPVQPGELLVVDEASMVPTADLAAVEAIATRFGAKILLTGDTAQLSAPGAGGAMRLLAGEHGYYQLRTVQRFDQEWERQASLRLRTGDLDAIADYDGRGRILEGTPEEMAAAACRRWLADYLSSRDALLLATTNVQAVELARRARDELAGLGLAGRDEVVELGDGNVAGPGDLIVARKNDRIIAGAPGRRLANRDVLRFDRWGEIGEERIAVVRRRLLRPDPVTGQVRWSASFELPELYMERYVQLAYAGTVHAAEGRTVDAAHLVVDETAGRESFYVGMSRGRARNTAYVVRDRARISDPSPVLRPAPDIRDPAAGKREPWRIHRFAVLGEVLEREQGQLAAVEVLRQEQEQAVSLATLAPVWVDVTRAHATRSYEWVIELLLGAGEWRRYEQDAERGTLIRLLRAAELAGHDVDEVLGRAAGGRSFAGARSIAAVLHGRVRRIVGTAEPLASASYAERMPRIADPEAALLAGELARAMDKRAEVLGERAALDRPVWALRYLGDVPGDPVERADWVRRAGAAAAYREERGYDRVEAIGPAPERGSPEMRASWHVAYTALRMPELEREIAAATDGELLARRAVYERETRWAPPNVAQELRDACIAEDTYRADAVNAWRRADAVADLGGREEARREAEGLSVLAQDVGARREQLAEVDEARRAWFTATEESRQRALVADSELRRRRPGMKLPSLHPDEELALEPGDLDVGGERGAEVLNVAAALEAARRVHVIVAERQRQAGQEAEIDSDDVIRRRETEAMSEAAARQNAIRQEPLPSRRAEIAGLQELEMEAGQ